MAGDTRLTQIEKREGDDSRSPPRARQVEREIRRRNHSSVRADFTPRCTKEESTLSPMQLLLTLEHVLVLLLYQPIPCSQAHILMGCSHSSLGTWQVCGFESGCVQSVLPKLEGWMKEPAALAMHS